MTTARALLDAFKGEQRRDVEVVLCHVLGKSRAWLYSHGDDALPNSTRRTLAALLDRLRGGEPVAYLIGEREFWGLSLSVTHDVLIPRPETELVVELALNRLSRGAHVVDLGTGCGALAIAIKSERADCTVMATDRSDNALRLARANAKRHGLDIEFQCRDWLEGLGAFDLIVSNPPYVRSDDPHLPALRFEPEGALVAGADGLEAITRILTDIRDHLRSAGHVIIEHGFDQGAQVRALFNAAGLSGVATFSDLGGRERATLGTR